MGDLIANFLTFFQATFFWQVVYGVLSPIWNDVVGRIFILTTFSYLIGFSVYVGYLGYFAGGFGSLSLNRLGIQISDLITLFPSAAITVVRVIQASFVKTFVKICVFVLYHLSAIFIGVIIALGFSKGYARQINEDWTPIVAQAGAIIFIVSTILPDLFRALKIKNKVLTRVAPWLMETLGIFLFAITIEPSTSNIPINPTTSQPVEEGVVGFIFRLILGFGIFLFAIYLIFLLPLILGLRIAETTVEENILSRITYLFLKQPLACLRDFEEEQLPRGNKPVPWPQRWFAKPSIEVNIQPDVYTYVFGPDKPAYLVDSFQSGTALYLPAPAGSTKARGKLIIIAQELLYGMEVQSAPSLSEEKPPPQKKP